MNSYRTWTFRLVFALLAIGLLGAVIDLASTTRGPHAGLAIAGALAVAALRGSLLGNKQRRGGCDPELLLTAGSLLAFTLLLMSAATSSGDWTSALCWSGLTLFSLGVGNIVSLRTDVSSTTRSKSEAVAPASVQENFSGTTTCVSETENANAPQTGPVAEDHLGEIRFSNGNDRSVPEPLTPEALSLPARTEADEGEPPIGFAVDSPLDADWADESEDESVTLSIPGMPGVPDLSIRFWSRHRESGLESLEATLAFRLSPGEKHRYVHVALVPFFASLPAGECECISDGDVLAEFDSLQRYGGRISVRRRGDASQPLDVELCLMLSTDRANVRAA